MIQRLDFRERDVWVEQFLRNLSCGIRAFLVTGNVRDVTYLDIKNGHKNLAATLACILNLEVIVSVSLANGLRFAKGETVFRETTTRGRGTPPQRDDYQQLAGEMQRRQQQALTRGGGAQDLLGSLRVLLQVRSQHPTLILLLQPEDVAPAQGLPDRSELAILRELVATQPGAVESTTVLITENPRLMHASLQASPHNGIKHIEIPIPDFKSRRRYLSLRDFLAQGPLFAEHHLDRIADETAGMRLVEIEGLFALGKLTPQLVQKARYGEERDRWKDLNARWDGFEAFIRERYVGQDEAVQRILRILGQAVSGMRKATLPVSRFLLVGPTGVGKTEIVHIISEFVFGARDRVLKYHMENFKDKHTSSQLVGAPPGYVGYGEPGLVDKLIQNPQRIALFDEIEKAHSDIFDLFLHMTEGSISDSRGRCARTNQCAIFFASNVGTQAVANAGSMTEEQRIALVDDCLKQTFKPELLNRLKVIHFRSLTLEEARQVLDIEIKKLSGELSADKNLRLHLDFDESARQLLLERGFSAEYNARRIRDVLEETVCGDLSEKMRAGEIRAGARVGISVAKGSLDYRQA